MTTFKSGARATAGHADAAAWPVGNLNVDRNLLGVSKGLGLRGVGFRVLVVYTDYILYPLIPY